MWDRRLETGDRRLETGGMRRRRGTGKGRQETWDRKCETWGVRQKTWDRRQETWERRRETWDMIQDTQDRRHDTGDIIQNTSNKRHHRRDMIQFKRLEPFFPQLTTKHSDTQHFININVCDRSQRKSDTFSMLSITNMSVIDYETFWHCRLGEMTFQAVYLES